MNHKVSAIYKESVLLLTPIYGEREAESILNLLFEDHLGITRIHRLTNPEKELSESNVEKLQTAMPQLLKNIPVQHIIGFAYFMDRKYLVNKHTLIPRPETEELAGLILDENDHEKALDMLDIGTGTGCIAISLALGFSQAKVTGWDISERAVEIARQNSQALGTSVIFEVQDVLQEVPPKKYDLIVSNPPYIPETDRADMHENVVGFEPEGALFVPNDDPLIFYRRIAELGFTRLNPKGKLYFEIHEDFGLAMKEMLEEKGYTGVEVFQDLNSKDRMVRALLI
ncbi:MAG: peptide chain release factor N(5)-glutamine methyltransferase [Marinoscillum sp.]|uniref:peptide chain release factor N(5)-glutamine methyltransferase n=1 Tax=Marinoscillum sp. TaxID=2024838 RepID=UPI003301FB9E